MPEISLFVIKIPKGRFLLIINRYTFTYEKEGVQKFIWECVCWKSNKCNGRVHTNDSFTNPKILTKLGGHYHEPNPMACEVKKVMNAIKESAITRNLQPNQIIATHTVTLLSASKGVIRESPV